MSYLARLVALEHESRITSHDDRRSTDDPSVSFVSTPEGVCGRISAVRVWLKRIGETDPNIIAELLEKARSDPAALAWFLEQEVATRSDPVRQRLSEALQNDPCLPFVLEALDADSDPVRVLVAVRGVGTAELTIPAAAYDPFRLLEMLAH